MTSQDQGGNTLEHWRETLLEPLKDFAALSEALHRKLQESKPHGLDLCQQQEDAAVSWLT